MQQDFDYIVVGAGSSGSVLAERLSVDPRNRVLLVEEGPHANWMSRMPKGYGKLMAHPVFAHFYPTTRPEGSRGPQETWVRGRMLGGSSAINGQVWIRGSREDYDSLAAAGNPGWGWDEMLPCLKALENHHLGASEYRGSEGPVRIRTNPARNRWADACIAAGVSTGLDVKDDQNGPVPEGIGYAQWNIDDRGRRVSAGRAFVEPALSRPNLVNERSVRVSRIIFENRRAVGIAATQDGKPVEFRARRAVILSAGTMNTPKLLQLSGIGDPALLGRHGIEVVHSSPMVGQRLHEHLTLALHFRLRDWQDSDNRAYSGVRLLGNVMNYFVRGKGPMARGAAEVIGFIRSMPGSNRPDTQLMFNPYSMAPDTNAIAFESEPGMQVYSYILRPESQGSVEIASADPGATVKSDPNYLATERDCATAIAATRAIRNLIAQPALAGMVVGETEKTAWATSDEEILQLYDRYGHSGHHGVGTAAMGPNDHDVVDHRLRVRGVDGLLVADCSVFPQIPAGNTNAPAMALGWRAAEIILEDAR